MVTTEARGEKPVLNSDGKPHGPTFSGLNEPITSHEIDQTKLKFRDIDTNNLEGMLAVLELLTNPENSEFLEGISKRTTVFDLKEYYSEEGRHGRVAIYPGLGIVGVYDITAPSQRKREDSVSISGGIVNRFAIRLDLHGRGLGKKLLEDAENFAFQKLGLSNIRAGVVMNERDSEDWNETNQKPKNQKRRARRSIIQKVLRTDPRGRLLIGRDWEDFYPTMPNVRVGGKPRQVLWLQKTREVWEEEQRAKTAAN